MDDKELLYTEQCYEKCIAEYIVHLDTWKALEKLCIEWLLLRKELEDKVTHWCYKLKGLREKEND